MKKKIKSYETDMTSGSIIKSIIKFWFPLVITGLLQLAYNAADVIVVGQFAGQEALAAVGSTGSLTNLLVGFFINLSVGTSVCVAKYYGAKDEKRTLEASHTSIALGIILGVVAAVLGFILSKPALQIMQTPSNIIDGANLYMRIYFIGTPAVTIYNFASMIMRATGDTKRPLRILTLSGIVNVVLNLVFVIVFKMSVAGVAYATIISQYMSAIMVIYSLATSHGFCAIRLKNVRIHLKSMAEILKIGVPAGIQSIIFSFSNVLLQSSINSFDNSVINAGNSAAGNIEGFVYILGNSAALTATTAVGQNLGANKFDRIKKSAFICAALGMVTMLVASCIIMISPNTFLSLYSSGEEFFHYGLVRFTYVLVPYFLCGAMESFSYSLRGIGYSMFSMIATVIGVCFIRIGYIYTIFAQFRSIDVLLMCYPISWFATALVLMIFFIFGVRKLKKKSVEA